MDTTEAKLKQEVLEEMITLILNTQRVIAEHQKTLAAQQETLRNMKLEKFDSAGFAG